MRRKPIILGIVAAASVLVLATTAVPASAKPTYSNACSGCHPSDSGVSVSLNATSSGATDTTYAFSISGGGSAFGYGVFDSAGTKVAGGSNASGTFTVPNGGSYTFYGVSKAGGSMQGSTSATLNPTAPSAPPPSSAPPSQASPQVSSVADWRIKGTLEGVNGETWTISGIAVTVNASSTVRGDDPVVGSRVKAKGTILPGGTLLAEKVKVKTAAQGEDEEDDEDEPEEADDERPESKRHREGKQPKPGKQGDSARSQVCVDNEEVGDEEDERTAEVRMSRVSTREMDRGEPKKREDERRPDGERSRLKKTER